MNVLITGGGGFIGSHLVDSQLAQGYRVRVLDLDVTGLAHVAAHPNLEVSTGDIADIDRVKPLLEGIDVVYHLASAHLNVSLPRAHYWKVNVEASVNLLKAAHSAGVQRLVHCSTVGVIGNVENPPANENSPCHPTNVYERTKLAGEQAVLSFARETGFPVAIARPAWVYGPRCPRTRKLFRVIGKRNFVWFGNGDTLRHPIYISDAVRGLELCAESENAPGEVYILAGKEPVAIKTLVQTIAEIQLIAPPHLHLPISLGKMAGYTVQLLCKPFGIQPPISRRSLDFFLKNNAYSISKAQNELGFQPKVNLPTGLRKTLRSLEVCPPEINESREQWMRPYKVH